MIKTLDSPGGVLETPIPVVGGRVVLKTSRIGRWLEFIYTILQNVGPLVVNNAFMVQLDQVPVFANNAAAILGGLTPGNFYRSGADPDALRIVH